MALSCNCTGTYKCVQCINRDAEKREMRARISHLESEVRTRPVIREPVVIEKTRTEYVGTDGLDLFLIGTGAFLVGITVGAALQAAEGNKGGKRR